MKVISSIFFALVLTSAGDAHSEGVGIRFEERLAQGQLTPVPSERSYDCDAPSIPAEIVLSDKLRPSEFDLSPFLPTDATRRQVTVRRSGQVGQSLNDKHSKPMFSRPNTRRKQQIEATDMSLSMTLSFCEYKGLLEFVGADYVLSGQVGKFRVYHHETLGSETPSALSLNYRNFNWNLIDIGHFLPSHKYEYSYTDDNSLGALLLNLELEAEPFEPVEGEGELLVDISIRSYIRVRRMGESP